MRVAFIAPVPAGAFLEETLVKPRYRSGEHGAPWVRALAEGLAASSGADVHVFADSRAVSEVRTRTLDGVAYTFLPKYEPIRTDPFHAHLPGIYRMRRAIRAFQPDLVLGFGTETSCGYVATRMPGPSIVFIQGIVEKTAPYQIMNPLRLAAYRRAERKTLAKAHAFIAETAFAREWVLSHNPRAQIKIIPHAMDTYYLGNTPRFDGDFILAACSLNRIKGPDFLIRAFAKVRHAGARLIIAGEGGLRGPLEALVRELDLAGRVELIGQQSREQLREWMRHARVLALGSRMDTSPNIITEAHAAGLPVISTRTGGIPDMINHGQDGHLVDPDDDVTMAASMDYFLDRPEEAGRMGAAGREKVRTLNDPARIAAEYAAFFADVVRKQSVIRLQRREKKRRFAQWSALRYAASVIPASIRAGSEYWRWRRLLDDVSTWSRDRIEAWQLDRLKHVVDYAYRHTRGYRELYRRIGFEPGDLKTFHDFQKLPFVTKEVIRDHLELFSSKQPDRRYATTGGSTGIPMGFYHNQLTRTIEQAFMHSSWSWAGWKFNSRSAVLRGSYVGSPDRIAAYDPYYRELRLSSYYLGSESLPAYLDILQREKISILQAYPSSLNLLCDLLREAPHAVPPALKLILLGSENIYDWQMEKFREIFPAARFFGWYGQSEQVILAPWCEHSNRYHARPLYGITELLDSHDIPVPDGEEGELVGTSLHNFNTPFIRYRTMDRAVRAGSSCPDCGRQFMVMSRISGRAHEVIVTATGRYISMTAINMHDDTFDGLRQFQFFQDQPGRVTFRYAAASEIGPAELERIRRRLLDKLGADMKLALEAVSEIPRTRTGKFRFLDQRLPIRYGDRTA